MIPFKPEGSKDAKICIVGEALGEEEERTGKPFVGPAGNLLNQCLHSAVIARGECYITNVVKVRPKGNDISPFYDNKRGFTKAGLEYVQSLKMELEECKANIFVATGNVALTALTGIQGISKYRGSILESNLILGKKVIPTIHPAAALREYLYKYSIIADLKRARAESAYPEIRRVKRELIINPSFDEAMAYLEKFSSEKKQLCFDIEVVNQELSCIAFAWSPTHAVSIPMTTWTFEQEIAIWKAIAKVLEDREISKVGQNLMFDTTFLMQKSNIITRGRLDDTMVAHHVTYYDFLVNLGFLCSIYANEPYYKDEGKMHKLQSFTEDQKRRFWLYNAKDAAVTFECWKHLERELDKKSTRAAYELSMSLFPVLQYMQLRGIKAKREELASTKKSIIDKQNNLQKELNSLVGHELNVGSSKQCIKYFYIEKGITPYISRKTKAPTCDDKALARMARRGIREAYLAQEIRGLRTLRERYLDIEFDLDDRLRCSYNAGKDGKAEEGIGTVTGRLSSSQTIFGTGANLQNIPPEFKTFLVADDGYILCEIDKRQAEWIDVAFIVGDANMIEVIEKKLDAHIKTAHLMFNAPPDLIKSEDKVVGKTTDEFLIQQLREEKIPEILKYNPVRSMSVRQAGKKSNHSFNYGLSPMGFSLQYMVDFQEAKRCYELYHKAYPTIKLWHKSIIEQLQRNRTLSTCFGRVRWFADRWGEDLFKAAYSFKPQSEVADGLNIGLRDIYNDIMSAYYNNQSDILSKVDLLGQVHDSILFQFPSDSINELAKAVSKMRRYLEPTMEHGGRQFIIPTDVKIGYNWGTMVEVNHPPEELSRDITTLTRDIEAAIKILRAEG